MRLFNTVGPRQTGAVRDGACRGSSVRRCAGEDLTVYGTGAQTRCFTHVRDTVGALMLLCDSDDAQGRTFNIGSATPIAIDRARAAGDRADRQRRAGSCSCPTTRPTATGFEELGHAGSRTRPRCETSPAGRHAFTVDDAIDDVIDYERALALDLDGGLEGTAADVA